uniref:Transforming acidic coiled-coil-containing protein C-terminal domain-containing protein n=1 Tax=Parascaris univalens TaxID=6257 RepID=A0A915CB02_PARUN
MLCFGPLFYAASFFENADLLPTSEQQSLTSGNISLSMTASPVCDRNDVSMEISFGEGHPTDPNGGTTEMSHSSSAMDISMGGTSEGSRTNLRAVGDSVGVGSSVSEVATFKEADEPGHLTHIGGTAYETPIKKAPTPNIDSRTITRPTKKGQNLPEAVVAPISKRDLANEAAQMAAADDDGGENKRTTESAVATALPDVLVASTMLQETNPTQLAPSIPSQTLKTQSLPQSAAPPAKPTTATGADISQMKITEQSRREEQRVSQRVRQRTVTVHNQLSMDIAGAFSEVKQMDVEDPLTEAQRRIQVLMVTKEKEWVAKMEKLTQALVHEQKKNDSLEQKAAERLLLLGEHEHVIRKLVEELKQQGRKGGKGMPDSTRPYGGPGPERTLSPDDFALIVKERDQLAEDVNSLESSYADLFRRYEKLRQTSIDIKSNEERTKKDAEEIARRYGVVTEKLEMLRQNAEEQLDLANSEIDRILKQHENDTLALRLKVKQLESKNETLAISVEAKQREIDEMTVLFEEVINKAEDS